MTSNISTQSSTTRSFDFYLKTHLQLLHVPFLSGSVTITLSTVFNYICLTTFLLKANWFLLKPDCLFAQKSNKNYEKKII